MRRWLSCLVVGVGVLLALSGGAARPAQACGSGSGDIMAVLVVGALVVGAADVGFTIADLAAPRLPPAYGVAELVLTAPQAVLFGWSTVQAFRDGDAPVLGVLATAWTGALAIHGAMTVARGASPSPQEEARRRSQLAWGVAPAVLSGGGPRAQPVAGAMFHGRF